MWSWTPIMKHWIMWYEKASQSTYEHIHWSFHILLCQVNEGEGTKHVWELSSSNFRFFFFNGTPRFHFRNLLHGSRVHYSPRWSTLYKSRLLLAERLLISWAWYCFSILYRVLCNCSAGLNSSTLRMMRLSYFTWWIEILSIRKWLGGGLNHFLFSPLFGEDFPFD